MEEFQQQLAGFTTSPDRGFSRQMANTPAPNRVLVATPVSNVSDVSRAESRTPDVFFGNSSMSSNSSNDSQSPFLTHTVPIFDENQHQNQLYTYGSGVSNCAADELKKASEFAEEYGLSVKASQVAMAEASRFAEVSTGNICLSDRITMPATIHTQLDVVETSEHCIVLR